MITLSSDFGSPYPAAMKGVILQASDARLVDVAHDFPRQDVRAAAFWLREVLPTFPAAVHLVVVDPGVGTARAALAIRAGDHALVGPDNGVLLPAARELASKQSLEPFEIEYEPSDRVDPGEGGQWPSVPASVTFHGRDVFAPAAARVHETGIDSFEEGRGFSPVDPTVDLTFPDPDREGERAVGEVLVVDGFGNVITNIPGSTLEGTYGEGISVNGERVPVRETYARVEPGERLVTVGSHGNVELAVNQGRGDDAFALSVGEAVELDPV